jgi:hypothetical protein
MRVLKNSNVLRSRAFLSLSLYKFCANRQNRVLFACL